MMDMSCVVTLLSFVVYIITFRWSLYDTRVHYILHIYIVSYLTSQEKTRATFVQPGAGKIVYFYCPAVVG